MTAKFKVLSESQIQATVPVTATGGPILVTTPGGTTASDTPFTVLPTITGFSPGTIVTTQPVTITGSGFDGALQVMFGDYNASSFTVVSPTTIRANVARDDPWGGTITVIAEAGAAESAQKRGPDLHPASPPRATDVASIDPALAYSQPSWQLEAATCGELLRYPVAPAPAGSTLVPDLAAALPAVSGDGLTYTFTIRDGAHFSHPSDEAISAETLRSTIERTLDPGLGSPAIAFVHDIAGEDDYEHGTADHISASSPRVRRCRSR